MRDLHVKSNHNGVLYYVWEHYDFTEPKIIQVFYSFDAAYTWASKFKG